MSRRCLLLSRVPVISTKAINRLVQEIWFVETRSSPRFRPMIDVLLYESADESPSISVAHDSLSLLHSPARRFLKHESAGPVVLLINSVSALSNKYGHYPVRLTSVPYHHKHHRLSTQSMQNLSI